MEPSLNIHSTIIRHAEHTTNLPKPTPECNTSPEEETHIKTRQNRYTSHRRSKNRNTTFYQCPVSTTVYHTIQSTSTIVPIQFHDTTTAHHRETQQSFNTTYPTCTHKPMTVLFQHITEKHYYRFQAPSPAYQKTHRTQDPTRTQPAPPMDTCMNFKKCTHSYPTMRTTNTIHQHPATAGQYNLLHRKNTTTIVVTVVSPGTTNSLPPPQKDTPLFTRHTIHPAPHSKRTTTTTQVSHIHQRTQNTQKYSIAKKKTHAIFPRTKKKKKPHKYNATIFSQTFTTIFFFIFSFFHFNFFSTTHQRNPHPRPRRHHTPPTVNPHQLSMTTFSHNCQHPTDNAPHRTSTSTDTATKPREQEPRSKLTAPQRHRQQQHQPQPSKLASDSNTSPAHSTNQPQLPPPQHSHQ